METATIPEELEACWKQLDCGFPRVEPVFADCMRAALAALSKEGVEAYIEGARFLGKMGRGAEPILIFLEEWPSVAKVLGEGALTPVMDCIRRMTKSPISRLRPHRATADVQPPAIYRPNDKLPAA